MPYALILLISVSIPGHKDWSQLPSMCESCHVGHGVPGEKLMPLEDPAFCLQCHGGPSELSSMVKKGYVASHSKPHDLSQSMNLPYRHPESYGCLSCHAGHGVETVKPEPRSAPGPSTLKANQFEYELCRECHPTLATFLSPTSSHPVMDPQNSGKVPSLLEPFSKDSWLNCSTCHRSDDPTHPLGVHASNYPSILQNAVQIQDGFEESEETYALCYGCHERTSILADESFPLHRNHVVKERTSCYTCHDNHGSRMLPWLLTFEDGSRKDRIFPDSFGQISFHQTGNRAGTCTLICHGVEHNDWSYGPGSDSRNIEQRRKQLYRNPTRQKQSSFLEMDRH